VHDDDVSSHRTRSNIPFGYRVKVTGGALDGLDLITPNPEVVRQIQEVALGDIPDRDQA